MNDHITRQLREAAEAHQPDRARILARVERGAAGPPVRHRTPPFARSWPRAVLGGLAAAGILATGGLAVAAIVGTQAPSDTVTTAPAAPSPTAAETATPSPARPAPPVSAAPAPTAAPTTAAPTSPRPTPTASGRPQNGPLWSDGSVDPHTTIYWGQDNLVLKTTQPLTSLTVEMRVAQTGEVRDTGKWHTLPGDDFTVTVQESGGALVYRWVLKPGRTVPVGQYEFADQFNHATGARSTAGDSYRVDAQSAGGPASVWGDIGPTR
ncbi:hypothetical protein BX285_4314 [Streptomyces sp. 1114.5]|uniref:hypothetical protein n=1 Tax=unclassified Streptomyces TaxID=2593676 RepID=UPI000BD730C0|nr:MULTISPECIES: hypothetical protein [unclassified Streptomyces]RKT19844.1 hypothetical protein BX285_4314 [Streptomyces sp. 1114.5]SOB86043.1 hypothetical protein SAMN06272789_6345 [Streptomyces sp. 1331.2]